MQQVDLSPDESDLELEELSLPPEPRDYEAFAGTSAGASSPAAVAATRAAWGVLALGAGVALIVAMAAVWAGAAAARVNMDSALLPAPTLVQGTTTSGLRYRVYAHPWPRGAFASNLHVEAGSLHEDADQLGLAHLLEHMAFDKCGCCVLRLCRTSHCLLQLARCVAWGRDRLPRLTGLFRSLPRPHRHLRGARVAGCGLQRVDQLPQHRLPNVEFARG